MVDVRAIFESTEMFFKNPEVFSENYIPSRLPGRDERRAIFIVSCGKN